MLFNLLGSVAVAAVTGLLMFLVRRHFWRTMPRWVLPAAAGLAMIVFSIWNSYAWYGRITDHLSEGVVVAATYPTRSPIEPWTYAFPRVQHFVAVNMAGRTQVAGHPEIVFAEVIEFQQFKPVRRSLQIFDCRTGRMGNPPAEEPQVDAAGTIIGVDWSPSAAGAPIIATACGT